MSFLSRRRFLTTTVGSSAALALGAAMPRFLRQAALGAPPDGNDHVLVVVQLTGGNDGLNTVAPVGDDAYHRARTKLAIAAKDALKIDNYLGFHPALRGFSDLFGTGEMAIVQGVGYPQPNRSHFESMDIWHTCYRKDQRPAEGWIGRYLDAAVPADGGDVPALHIGSEQQPRALIGHRVRSPSIQKLEEFQLHGKDAVSKSLAGLVDAPRAHEDPLLGFLQTSMSSALVASQKVEEAARQLPTSGAYPDSGLAAKLRLIAQLIQGGLKTRVFYVALDGFDTHSQQPNAHAALLKQLGDSVAAFHHDLAATGQGDRVLTMCFSEFGRRLAENASEGTDHGAAAPMFCFGRKVHGGLVGKHPSLTDLEDGDVRFAIDFRQVYATLLEKWLGWPSQDVLGGAFEQLQLVKA